MSTEISVQEPDVVKISVNQNSVTVSPSEISIDVAVNPVDPTIVTISNDQGPQGIQGIQGNVGPTGDIGVVISGTAPSNIAQLWADTSTSNAQVAVFDGGTPSSQITSIKIRRGLASAWTNQVLDAGEIGFETDTLRFKVGNGSTAWSSLSYAKGDLPASPTISNPTLTGTVTMTGATVTGGTISGGSA